MDRFVRNIVSDPDKLAEDFIASLSEYLLKEPSGIGMFTISPIGKIFISDEMHVNDLDYHDHLNGLLKYEYPEEAFMRMEEYNRKYPDLTDEELNAEPVFNPETGWYEHPYHKRILERHFEEMEIKAMATASIRVDKVREMCRKAIHYFQDGPVFTESDCWWCEDVDERLEEIDSRRSEWESDMEKFLGFMDDHTRQWEIDYYDNDNWRHEGLAPDYPVKPEDFNPEDDYHVKDLFYHQDMEVFMAHEWKKNPISRVIARQLCNDFYFALFMDELDEGGVTDTWWFSFSYAEPSARVYTAETKDEPESNQFYGHFRVKEYIIDSNNDVCPKRLDVPKVIELLTSLGL